MIIGKLFTKENTNSYKKYFNIVKGNNMYKFLVFIFFITSTNMALADNPKVLMKTNVGDMVIELDMELAPKTVENFLRYVESEFYTDTIFHRVIPGFMIQGGGYSSEFEERTTNEAIKNEADNGLTNMVGTIAMARTNQPHSATAQFFINVANNRFLNHTSKSLRGWGYAVFGKVVQGMDVVKEIAGTPTGRGGPFAKDVPNNPIIIQSVSVLGN